MSDQGNQGQQWPPYNPQQPPPGAWPPPAEQPPQYGPPPGYQQPPAQYAPPQQPYSPPPYSPPPEQPPSPPADEPPADEAPPAEPATDEPAAQEQRDDDTSTQFIPALPADPAATPDAGQHTAVFPTVPPAPTGQQSAYGQPPQQAYGQPQQPAYGQPEQPPYGAPAGYGQQQAYGQPQQPAYGEQPAYGQPQQPAYGEQPAYGQPQQPAYGAPAAYGEQQAYGQPQQPAYGAPAYGQQPYGAPDYGPGPVQPGGPARKKGKGLLYTVIGLLVLIAVLVVVSFVAKIPTSLYPKKLSHSAVEKYVGTNFSASGVTCNGGKDYTIKKGKTFTCTADQSSTFTVTLTNNDGKYVVSKN